MSFNPGDVYQFVLNITDATNVTSAPTITVLDVSTPSSPVSVVTAAGMTLISGTGFVYVYRFTVPAGAPKDYVAIVSYATNQSLGTATAASEGASLISFTFPTPLPDLAQVGNLLTTLAFSPSGYNVTDAEITSVNFATGVIQVASGALAANSVLGTGTVKGNVSIVSGKFLGSLHVGDSYIVGPVALNAIVARDATVAKDATVLKTSSYVAPQNDPMVQAINTNISTIMTGTAVLIAAVGSPLDTAIAPLIQDIYDATFGSVHIDQTVNPPVLHIKRVNGTEIASFQLVNNSTNTDRIKVTNPSESSV